MHDDQGRSHISQVEILISVPINDRRRGIDFVQAKHGSSRVGVTDLKPAEEAREGSRKPQKVGHMEGAAMKAANQAAPPAPRLPGLGLELVMIIRTSLLLTEITLVTSTVLITRASVLA